MKKLVLLLALGVSACSVAPKSANQASYETTASFVAALKGANTYAAMPRCTVAKPPCSEQAIVSKIADEANKANIAVLASQAIAKDTTAPATDVQKAEAAANDAVAALVQLIPAQK